MGPRTFPACRIGTISISIVISANGVLICVVFLPLILTAITVKVLETATAVSVDADGSGSRWSALGWAQGPSLPACRIGTITISIVISANGVLICVLFLPLILTAITVKVLETATAVPVDADGSGSRWSALGWAQGPSLPAG